MNDLPEAIKSSEVAMFADDTKIFKAITSLDDSTSLQADLNSLETWSSASGLGFNPNKCKSQCITRKIKPIVSTYKFNNSALISTETERDLGVWVSKDLTWNKQVYEQSARANKLLGYIRRNTRCINSTNLRRTLYLALVRSHLGYATQLWSPQTVELTIKLERIQRRATKYILNLPFSTDMDYNSRLQSLYMIPICYWHEYLDMVLFFKVTHNLVNLKPSVLPVVRISRPTRASTGNAPTYTIPRCKTATYQRSFFVRTCRIWNTLAEELKLTMDNLSNFKSTMMSYYMLALINTYNCEDSRSFKSICQKCNRARNLTHPVKCCM